MERGDQVSYAVYELPFGKDKINLGTAGNAILGHWQTSGIWQWHGGFAMTPDGPDISETDNPYCCRLNCTGPPQYLDASSPLGGIQWFSSSPYVEGPDHSFGTCSNGVVRGPGLDTLDLSFQRVFPLSESRRIQFRVGFINFTNTPILETPNIFGPGSTVGRVSGSQGERNIQFALKFYF